LAFQLEEVAFVEPFSRVKIRIATGWVAGMHARIAFTKQDETKRNETKKKK
jgi:hypothetical protein